MAVLIRFNIVFIFLNVLISGCSSSDQKDEIDPYIALIDSVYHYSQMDKLGMFYSSELENEAYLSKYDLQVYCYTENDTLVGIDLEILPKDSISSAELLNRLFAKFTSNDSTNHCNDKFCSWYGKSDRNKVKEVFVMDESEVRGKPYIAFRIREKDEIAE